MSKLNNVRIKQGNPIKVTKEYTCGKVEEVFVDTHSEAMDIFNTIETEHTTPDPDFELKSINIVAHTEL
jgi:hypothetical protein